MRRAPRRAGPGPAARVLTALLAALALPVQASPDSDAPALAVPAGPATAAARGPEESPGGTEALEREVDELRLRVQGMEGKLKDSAVARRGADQARMEAERRLAEALQDKAHLDEEAARLRELNLALETSLKESQAHAASLLDARAAAEDRARQIAAERDLLRALLPVSEGGTLTMDSARAQAAAAATALRRALAQAKGPRDGPERLAVSQAEQALSRCQLAVALAAGARGLYQVRPSDSLAQVASRFYGESSRWVEIQDANRHVVSDPDRLMPGTTLVIP